MCRVTASKLSINILKIQSFYTKNIASELKNVSIVLGVVAINIYVRQFVLIKSMKH
jgi:hypothetical protein